ncbi:MAG: branched-chain-amino-acid transaminase [Verrucomicrobiota bacterium]|jgi:branched-chain amino acid aminotransferase
MTSPPFDSVVWIDGRLVPATEATVSIFDRSFLYGDGLFETVRIHRSTPLHWDRHLHRLREGAKALRLQIPYSDAEITDTAQAMIRRQSATEAILRLTLSRGIGRRGYSIRGAHQPRLIITVHALPDVPPDAAEGWKLATSEYRLPARDPLTRFKTANKLIQVMARAEAEDAGADEALLLDTDGHLAETASGNLFWIADGVVWTPPLSTGALAGVTRSVVLELAPRLGLQSGEKLQGLPTLLRTDGVFVTQSSRGIISVTQVDGTPVAASPIIVRLREAYWAEAAKSGTP